MDLKKIKVFVKQYFGELFLILCGAVLFLFPGTAVSLVSKLTGIVLVAVGAIRAAGHLKDSGAHWSDWLWSAAYLLVGGYLLANPMSVANMLGRFLGTVLIINGIHDLKVRRYGSGRILSIVTAVAGVILVLIPRTLINTLLGMAGLVLVIIGVINLLDKLRHHRYLDSGGENPKIIDAVTED